MQVKSTIKAANQNVGQKNKISTLTLVGRAHYAWRQ